MRGRLDTNRQLDALAYLIVGKPKEGAEKLGISRSVLYSLANSAIKRLTPKEPADDTRALRLVPVIGKVA